MFGALFQEKEVREIEYLLKRELEELLLDIEDSRLSHVVRHAMEERYQVIFKILKRFASPEECMKYLRNKSNYI
ncbi:hypothetical protein PU629_21490 [Pullulanibacillus sp. KACC 23026]|uniref:hypothetical protein n=1 Tax=Pullulanibacillus sp. KACC 23026 TaxID=3028315 RepID=UPI0023B13689|nr:hypothetical protein [Pullulanibacillus sp. KACC 23026]WEG12620.1 hypothetical protein PU629_21490 [Pullulanibacillus sp. KACC 23026]